MKDSKSDSGRGVSSAPFFFTHKSKFAFSSQIVFDWHLRKGAFERMIPPWERVEILSKEGSPESIGSQMVLRMKVGGFWKKMIVQHTEFLSGSSFTDVQRFGPFQFWKHTHRVEPIDEGSCYLVEEIEYMPPLKLLRGWVEKRLAKAFEWRHETLRQDLSVQHRFAGAGNMRLLLSGSTGLVGSRLVSLLRSSGHEVVRLVRSRKDSAADTLRWDPSKGDLDPEALEGFDGVIHLAGKNISSGLWTEKLKKELFRSRCRDTWLLSQAFLRVDKPPSVFISASAVGIYGNRGEEELSEKSGYGKGFLADLCIHWEEASSGVRQRGIRVVHTRFGLILSERGGMLAKLLPLFRLGLGAVLGSGKQWMPWVALEDVIYILYHALMDERIEGPVNVVGKAPVTVGLFSEALSRTLHRPLFLRIGEKPLRWLMGEMAEEMLLTSQKVIPHKLEELNYPFLCPTIEDALSKQRLS